MQFSIEYFAVILNSTIRLTTPILYATLAAAICKKADVFNLSMEGAMISGAFFGIVGSYFTHNTLLAVLLAMVSGMILSAVVGYCIIWLKASPVIAGVAASTMMTGLTTYLLYVIFNTKGAFSDPSLVGLKKLYLFSGIPVLGTILSGLTVVDYLAIFMAAALYVFMYKTVLGYRLRAIGLNKEAARSLGTSVNRYQFITFVLSGALSALGGCLLSMGSVTLFLPNITSGRGFIALAANNLGNSHPLGVLAASFFFGFSQALGNLLQNTSIKTQLTATVPYLSTIIGMLVFNIYNIQKQKYRKQRKNSDEAGS